MNKRTRIFYKLLILALWWGQAGSAWSLDLPPALLGCEEHVRYGIPSMDQTFLCREGFALSHDDDRKIPRWVSYRLTREQLKNPVVKRSNQRFKPDPDLPKEKRAELADYQGSGYDRGHLVPAADMRWSRKAMTQSFYLSNMAPQRPEFNRGIWAEWEEKVRVMARERGEVWIITGPIPSPEEKTIGQAVTVPRSFFKILYDDAKKEVFAAVCWQSILACQEVSVDELEEQTGFDFLSELPQALQDQIESVWREWPQ